METDIYFRSSSFGNLMTENAGSVFTDKMAIELDDLKYELENGINRNGNKVKWSETKKLRVTELLIKRDAPPTLSKTAKTEIEKTWLFNEKGFWDDLNNKYLTKGLMNEQDGMGLSQKTFEEGVFFGKNEERVHKNNITGECDVLTEIYGKRTVIDIKCSWNPKTFMSGDLSKIYEYQLRCYMYLYDAEQAFLCYCLTDTPSHLIEREKKQQWYKYFDPDFDNEQIQLLEEKLERVYQQIENNSIFSTNKNYKESELVKTFKITRDLDIEKEMLNKIKPALEYYNSITLNQV